MASSDWRSYSDRLVYEMSLLCGLTAAGGWLSSCHSVPPPPGPLALTKCLFSQIWQNLIYFKSPSPESHGWHWPTGSGLAGRVFLREGEGKKDRMDRQTDRHVHRDSWRFLKKPDEWLLEVTPSRSLLLPQGPCLDRAGVSKPPAARVCWFWLG